MKYLAIDYGTKRIGLAICDRDETIVSPHSIIECDSRAVERITHTARLEQVEALVVGLPLNMDGTEGPQAKIVRQFTEELKGLIDLPIYFQDERLTSFAADHKLTPAELTGKKKKKRLDAVAAATILEAFIENKQNQP